MKKDFLRNNCPGNCAGALQDAIQQGQLKTREIPSELKLRTVNRMGGRFIQISSGRELYAAMNLSGPAVYLRPRYNIAPSRNAAVVRDDAGRRQFSLLRWGLIPAWAKKPDIGTKLINTRAESAAAQPTGKTATPPGPSAGTNEHSALECLPRQCFRAVAKDCEGDRLKTGTVLTDRIPKEEG